jgi:3-keto-5-aminohexanoate cleavage enzyme
VSEQESIWDYRDPHEWMKKTRTSALPPLIVVCAITGGIQGKEANPNIPETPEEQAEQTYDAYKAGASVVHIHARDPKAWYNCSGSAEVYRQVNGAIREKCPDIIINNTTGGAPGMTIEERLQCLEAKPEMATLNMGPDMFKMRYKDRNAPLATPRKGYLLDECFPTSFADVTRFAQEMKKRGVKPEMELYNTGMYWVVDDMMAQGLIDPPYVIQFVTGYSSGTYPTPDNLLGWVRDLPKNSIYFVAGLGPYQIPMNVMGVLLGGHVRVGLEDNVYLKRGQLFKSNAEAVERIVRIAKDMNREIATPAQAREMMGLSQKPNQF